VLLRWAIINLFTEKVNKIHEIGSEFIFCNHVTVGQPSLNGLLEIVLNFFSIKASFPLILFVILSTVTIGQLNYLLCALVLFVDYRTNIKFHILTFYILFLRFNRVLPSDCYGC
jgi:hypothetical protein